MLFHRKYASLFLIFMLLPGFRGSFAEASMIEKGLYFYRTPQSLFPSGQANRHDLERSLLRKEKDKTYLIEKDHKPLLIAAEYLVRDVDLSRILSPNGLPVMEDLGIVKNYTPCALRTKPSWTSDVVISIPTLTKLILVDITSNWALVEMQFNDENLRGYVDLSNLVMKFDFASFVLTKENKWRPVQNRDLGDLVLDQGEKIPLMDIRSIITRPDLGIVVERNDKLNLSLKNHLQIKRLEAGEWNISKLKGHGEVYWHDEIPEAWQTVSDDEVILTKDLLKREIASVAFHPKNPRWGIVSSQGVYITTDGEKWFPAKSFGKRDYPVAVNSKGDIIVGSYLSKNFDQHFEPYLRWEKLTNLIETQTKKSLPMLQIKNVRFLSNDDLKVSLDTGVRDVEMMGHPNKPDSWHLLN